MVDTAIRKTIETFRTHGTRQSPSNPERLGPANSCLATSGRSDVWATIPPKCNRTEPICFSPYLYRARNLVGRFFNKIKQCRRVATRYDKLAANYLAFMARQPDHLAARSIYRGSSSARTRDTAARVF